MTLGRGAAVALGLVSVLTSSAAVHAQAPPMRVGLTYQVEPAVQGCPTAEELRAAITSQLGSDPFVVDPSSAPQRVHIDIKRQPSSATSGMDAQITWLDSLGNNQGERHLSSAGSECAELASGVAFAVAVQIQLQAAEAQAQASAPSPPAPPRAPVAVAPASRRPPAERRSTAWLVGVGVYGQHGLSPETTGGLRLFGGMAGEMWGVYGGVQTTLPSTLRRADDTGIETRDFAARVAPCWQPRPWGVCAVGTVGGLYVRGEGVDHVGSPSTLIASAGARLQFGWSAHEHFSVLIHGEALALLTPRDVLLNRTVVWSTAPIVLGVGIDVAAVFR